jgi:threonine/homoserine efflux transporter RhtA
MQDYSWVSYLHILFVGPLLIYLGVQKNNVPDFVYIALIVMGVFVMAYHGYKLYNYLNK